MKKPLAIFMSDLHLSHNAPACRKESDWYSVMEEYIGQVHDLWTKLSQYRGSIPVFIAGDVFDRWNSPPQLISFAIDQFSKFRGQIYCIPGQHDLPNHNYDEVYRSAYGCIVRTKCCWGMRPKNPYPFHGFTVHPVPWGFDIPDITQCDDAKAVRAIKYIQVALVHSYIWVKGCQYPNAPEQNRAGVYEKELTSKGYDVAFFGDNHKGFVNGKIMNCGTLICRKSDEIDYRPMVGVLYSDGSIEPVYLDTSEDEFEDSAFEYAEMSSTREFDDYMEELAAIQSDSLDFRDSLVRRLNALGANDRVRQLVLSSLEG